MDDIQNKVRPRRWLTMFGRSGIGKSHIARGLYNWWKNSDECKGQQVNDDYGCIFHGAFKEWPLLATELRANKGGDDIILELMQEPFLVIDDIGAAADRTGFITGQLIVLLTQRMDKWTVITSNKSLEAVEKEIDGRIASRMIRGSNRCLAVDVVDYALREKGNL